ncbi:hypothetical protein E4U14_001305 [Claviceps sp. LM454 group G7]|nr:hypothetical protein E4U14_001305 [Claviceps sp. LM454 group G7]
MRRKCSSQEGELDSLKKLLYHIRTSTPEEVGKIVAYIRLYEDPVAAFNSYFSSTAAMYLTTEVGDETNEILECQIDPQCGSEPSESGAFPTRDGRVRAEALPPNTVASSEIVSNLISQYFIFERPLSLPSVDFQTFINDINKGDSTGGSHGSDLLVNAICAQQCFLSDDYSRGSVTQRYLGRRFLDECYRLLRLKDGEVTLSTAQAVTLIYQAELVENLFDLQVLPLGM